MLHITFVSQSLKKFLGYGTSTYACNLFYSLKKTGITVWPLTPPEFKFSPKSYVDFIFLIPLIMLLSKPQTRLYHFTVPQAGFIIRPFKWLHPDIKVVSTAYDLTPMLYKKPKDMRFGRGIVTRTFGLIYEWGTRRSLLDSDLLVAISSQTRDDVIKYLNVDPRKVVVAPIAADARFRPLQKDKNSIFTVGYVGAMAGHKDLPFLIRSYAILERMPGPPKRLLVYSAHHNDECVRLAQDLGIKNIEFRGFAPEAELVNIYNSFDAFVFPSAFEGFGLPILEAQKCGIPVLVKEGAHIPEEVTRFCLKAKDEEHLAKLMEKVRTEGFTFTKEHQKHLAQFTWENCAKKTIEAYEQALKS